MTKSISILVFVAVAAYAYCSACGGEQNWSATAANFLEGKPQSDAIPVWGPKAERLKNSQFSSDANKDQENTSGASETPESSANVPAISIRLINASAEPNSANSGSSVKITAVFKDSSSDSSGVQALLTAVATINDSAGAEVGKLSLLQSADNEYSGIWNASVAAGIYKATIVASSPQASETFKDALQIEIISPGNATSNTPGNVPVTKLG
jgi:hypothetical protein